MSLRQFFLRERLHRQNPGSAYTVARNKKTVRVRLASPKSLTDLAARSDHVRSRPLSESVRIRSVYPGTARQPDHVPPISVVLANAKEQYIAGLTDYSESRMESWVEHFAVAAAQAARLADSYMHSAHRLVDAWRDRLRD